MKFNKGDRVFSLRNNPDGNDYIKHGDTGTILGMHDLIEDVYYVRWDHYVGGSGHTCDGRCESGYGWNVYADWIDILDPKPEREYEPVSADEIRVLLGGCAV